MKRVLLLVVLALILPGVALADGIDFQNGGTLGDGVTSVSSMTATAGSTLSVTSMLTDVQFVHLATPGTVSVTTGTLTATAVVGIFTFTGGTISIMDSNSKILFSGTFTSGTVTASKNGWAIVGLVGNSITTQAFAAGIVSGDTIVVTPEPGTLGLLGTGLVGIAGLVRRKFKAA